ncbi:LAMI_0B01574g1_1 [Lachancea mirantina]|uniref:LAMI_0B01574g1_1 n=1 Tax=Lachancea mirantina TaxID=1230905 RepID=A0A1G4ITU7_9SACH|nr:LAMI_0B01574g1_1 [Lachancea mirantina]
MAVPETIKAVVIEGDKPVVKSSVKTPKIGKEGLLIKVKAAAGNPTDWKQIAYKIGPQGAISGCDLAGEVVELGPEVELSEFQVGDTVFGFVHGASVKFPDNGAFAEYSALDSKLAIKLPLKPANTSVVPEGPVTTFEAAASLPISLFTAAAVIEGNFKNKQVWEPKEPQHDFPILIWGGATGVGQFLIQLAKRFHGYTKIIAVASKKHEQILKEYGADELFDYHDKDVIEHIKSRYPEIPHLVDAVSNEDTIKQVYKVAASTKPARLVQLMTMSEENIPKADRRSNVTIDGTILYLATGHEVPLGPVTLPASPEYRETIINFLKFIRPKLVSGEIHHIPIKVYKNGLEDVPEVLEAIKMGKNSGEKLVIAL